MRLLINKIIIKLFIDNPYLKYIVSCHQLTDRSLHLNGRQFHICARCTGIVTGLLFSPILVFMEHKISFYLFFVGAVIVSIDGITQLMKLRKSNNVLRLISGFLFGFPFLGFVLYVAKLLFQELH